MSVPECPKLINPAEADEDLLQHFDVKVGKDGTKLLQCHLCKRLMRNVTFTLKWHLQHVCERIREKDKNRSMRSAARITPRSHYDDEGLVTHIKHSRIVCRHCHEAVTDRAQAMRAHVLTCLQGRTQPVEENAFAADVRRDYFEISPGEGGGGEGRPVYRKATCRHCQAVMQDRQQTMVRHLVGSCRATGAYGRVEGKPDTSAGSDAT